jgi:hypothetical protein
MQPEDEKDNFQQPAASDGYYSPAPQTSEVPQQADASQPIAVSDELTEEVPASPSLQSTIESSPQEPVQWQAAEYIHHEKNPLWYVGFGIVVLLLMAAAVFLIQSWTFALLIPVMAVALIAYSHRPPRMIDYVLSGKGLYINDTLHPFAEFKSFGVIHEEAEFSMVFIPVRRFRPGLTVYFPEDKGESIVDFLGVRLPMQPLKLDAFDKVVRFLGL